MSPADEVWECRLEIARLANEAAASGAWAVENACNQALDAFRAGDAIVDRLGVAAVLARDLGELGAPLLALVRRIVAIAEVDIRRSRATAPGGEA